MLKSIYAYCLAVIVILSTSLFFYPRFEKPATESTFGWDVSGYYWYLPSVFIYHDLKGQHFADSILAKYQFTPSLQQGFRADNGGFVLTYSSGMALMYSPFFAIGHVAAKMLGYPADGFSKPYMMAIALGSLFVCFLGLWFFRKLLRYYYSDSVTAIIIFLLAIGSNYLNYTAIDGALTHNWLFTLYVFLLLATRAFYERQTAGRAVAIGLLCGLAVLIRPSEIICVLIPLLWGLESVSLAAITQRLQFLRNQFGYLLIASGCAALVGSIQLFYWKYVSGHWFVYSYAEKGFSWKHPHLFSYTLSYRSGWITYTPLVIFLFIGILPFLKNGKNRVAILSFFALNLYIVSAWDIWWYGGTGGRAMIQSYPILFFPLASLIEFLLRKKVWGFLAAPFLVVAVYFNIWFTVQAHGGEQLYDPEGMTKAYYWRVAGRWQVPDEVQKLKDTDELPEGTPQRMRLIYSNDLETDSSLAIGNAIEGERSIFLDKVNPESKKYSFNVSAEANTWLRAEATFRIGLKEWTGWKMTRLTVDLYHRDSLLKERMMRVQRFLSDNETRPLFLDIRCPEGTDSAAVQFWNVESEHGISIDNIRVYQYVMP